MAIRANVIEEAERLVGAAAVKGITLRLLGGMAVRLHSPSAGHRSLERKYPDIDLVVAGKNRMDVQPFLLGEGYSENKTFNTLSGSHRQLYYDTTNNRQVDVFVGGFEMCHKLPIADRLNVEPLTIPLAELFLTKAQIVTLNRKDVLDLVALLLDHQVGAGDQETINSDVIGALCARDWGLYTTVTLNMQKAGDMVLEGGVPLEEGLAAAVVAQFAALKDVMEGAPKTLAWKMRAKMGTRIRWYEEVEEVQR